MSRKFQNSVIVLFLISAVFAFTGCWQSETKDYTKGSGTKTETYESSVSPTSTPVSENSNMQDTAANTTENSSSDKTKKGFNANLPKEFTIPDDAVGKKMLKEYGAMFVAQNGAVAPNKVVFNNEPEVASWQKTVSTSIENIGGISVELQTPAMNALKEAINEAKQSGQTITPNGADSAKRDYNGTVANWNSRVNPGFTHWVGLGKVSQADANRIKSLPIPEQIAEIFRLEDRKIYFAKSLDKSIIYSVAPPGTSQHISMLALDVKEHGNAKVREILANHGWFQTVFSDLPHFTYLGAKESDLPNLGLKKVNDGGRVFWMPDI